MTAGLGGATEPGDGEISLQEALLSCPRCDELLTTAEVRLILDPDRDYPPMCVGCCVEVLAEPIHTLAVAVGRAAEELAQAIAPAMSRGLDQMGLALLQAIHGDDDE